MLLGTFSTNHTEKKLRILKNTHLYVHFTKYHKTLVMNEFNKKNKIGRPYIIKEKSNGKWKVCFEYINNEGKRKREYYSKGLNDSQFFDLTKDGKLKFHADGTVKHKNVIARNELADKRIKRLQRDLTKYNYDISTAKFIFGDTDKPIKDLLNDFINFKEEYDNCTASSIKQYRTKANTLINYCENILDDETITILTTDKQFYLDFFKYLVKIKKRKLVYRDDCLTFLKMFYKWLLIEKKLEIENPLETIKKQNKDKTTKHKTIEANQLYNAVNELKEYNYYLGIMYQFIFFTLHRINTLVQLQYSDFDLKNNLINIPSHKTKNRQAVTIQLNKALKVIIQDYLKSNTVNSNDYLFGSTGYAQVSLFSPTPSTAKYFSNSFFKYKKQTLKSNNKTYLTKESTIYSAKHSGIKFLLDSGLNLNQIITITGHKNVEMLGTYAKEYTPTKVQFPELPLQE